MTGRPVDLTLYLVTDANMCGPRGVPATVAAAVSGGVTIVQVRDPGASDADFVEQGRAVRGVLVGTDIKLIINDRVHLVEAIGADGVHLGQGDTTPELARQILGPQAIVGLSVSTVEHMAAAEHLNAGIVDYLGVGPVWPTGTKPDHNPPIGPDGAAVIAAASPWPAVAIGGITAAQAPALRNRGLAGVAVVSAVCAAQDPAGAAAALRATWEGQL